MQESITVIENAIQEKKEFVRRLNHEREKLIEGLSDNFSNRISTEKKIIELEKNLKELYDLTYNQKPDYANKLKAEKSSKLGYEQDKGGCISMQKESEKSINYHDEKLKCEGEYSNKPSY